MENVFFYHGTTRDGHKFTMAGKIKKIGRILRKNVLVLGVSLCNPMDQFRKDVGRAKAHGRIESTKDIGKKKVNIPKDVDHLGKFFVSIAIKYKDSSRMSLQRDFNLVKADPTKTSFVDSSLARIYELTNVAETIPAS